MLKTMSQRAEDFKSCKHITWIPKPGLHISCKDHKCKVHVLEHISKAVQIWLGHCIVVMITSIDLSQEIFATDMLKALGPVHMIPGQLIASGQLTDPRVNFASVHGLTPVTVHTSFSLPRGNFERRVTRCTTPGNPPCRGNFSPCEQNAKVAPGQE